MPDWKPGNPLPEAQNAQIDPKKFDEYSTIEVIVSPG
jgi:hypothetical protein